MSISLVDSQTINRLAKHLYDFLPGKPHPYADPVISFKGVAFQVGVGNFWKDGSKLPSITQLFEKTFTNRREKFCDLILGVVHAGLMYKNNKGNPIKREEIKDLNELLLKLRFKIPDLWNPEFLNSLPANNKQEIKEIETGSQEQIQQLKNDLIEISKLPPQPRGFSFEQFLNQMFNLNDLKPRASFRLVGEQIDGSFQLGNNTYLLEAKWHDLPIGQADLLVFKGKVEAKSTWSRGIFISHSGFTDEGITAYSRGRPTNIIGMSGQDLYFIIENGLSLREVIEKKTRRAAETGEFFVSVLDLMYEEGA